MDFKLKYFIKAVMLTVIVEVAVSCEKLIETDFPNNQIASDLVFEDEQTAEAALAGLYSGMWETSMYSGGINGKGALLGTYTDDLTCFYTSASNGVLDLYFNQQLPTNSAVTAFWTSAYQLIYSANSIIEGVGKSKSLSQTVKDRVRSEALLVRSMLYMDLFQIFGEVPYTDTTDYLINSTLKRMPEGEFLTKVETDLSESVNLLPVGYRNAERIYPNKYAGYVALAKMKMLLKKWNESEVICSVIMQASLFSYQNDISKVFQKSGSHIIWQLKPKNTNDATKEASLYNFTAAPMSFAMNPNLVSSFSAADLRRQHYFTAVPFGAQINYKPAKYKNLAVNNPTEYSVIYRLDEVYLMQAENFLQQNKTPEAIPLINRSRQRAGLPALPSTLGVTEAMTELRQEKRREFFTEQGIRFFDLKRWGMLDQLNSVKPNWKSSYEKWPLPQKELLVNPNLNPQNTGY